LAIPIRPDFLPPVLQDVIAPVVNTPATPAAPAAGSLGPIVGRAHSLTRQEAQARSRELYKQQLQARQAPGYVPLSPEEGLARNKAQNIADLQATADRDDWPDFVRRAYGLPPGEKNAQRRSWEDMILKYRQGLSKELSTDAIAWAKQQPYLAFEASQWTPSAPSPAPAPAPAATAFPLLTNLLTNS
jgi:hypothetical protein